MIGIYIIENIVDNKVYIGQSWHIESRLQEHKRTLANNTHGNIHLQRAYNIYGLHNFKFSVLQDLSYLCDIQHDIGQVVLNAQEIYWIAYYGGCNSSNTYNFTAGGYGGEYSEEYKQRLSDKRKGKFTGADNPMYGKHHTDKTKQQISQKKKGSISPNKGIPHKQATKDKISKANKGRVQSDAEKNKRAKTMRLLREDPEFLVKCAEGRKKAAIKTRKYTDEFVLKLRAEHDAGNSIKQLSKSYHIPFESCRVMIKGIGLYANI